jgi:spermidine/putrescine transport system permease protein
LLYLPIVTIVVFSFNGAKSMNEWGGFSLHWYRVAWANEAVKEVTVRSLVVAFWATLIATVAATLAALATTRGKAFRGRGVIGGMVNQTLVVPEIVTAISLLIFFAPIKVASGYQGLGYLILAHTIWVLPLAYLPIRARLEGMDLSMETAAADLYATRWRTLRHVTLPLTAPAILAGAMLCFVTSLDTVVITEFVKSGGQDTLATFMLGQLRRQITPEINAISSALLGFTLILLTLSFLLTRKRD